MTPGKDRVTSTDPADGPAAATRSLDLPWGSEHVRLALPPSWELDGVLSPAAVDPIDDVGAAVSAGLARPIGSPPLADLADVAESVAIVVDDGSRPTPVASILPAVLAELQRAGVDRERITLVTALGLHRPVTAAELADRVGQDVLEGLRWENHDCDDRARLVELGRTFRGTPVLINRTVAESDLVVCVGCIEPHLIAGFGGGAKMLVPGVAGRETIGRNHALHCTPQTFDGVGRPREASPMRLDLEEAAALLRPPVFIVNAVLNGRLQVTRVVCGDPVEAHREGAAVSGKVFAVPMAGTVDVVVTDSHPMDQDLRQGMKAVGNTIRAVRHGGVLIALLRAEEGVGEVGLTARRSRLSPRTLRLLAPILVRLVPRMKLKDMGEEDRFFLYFALQAMRRARLLLYAPTVPPDVRVSLPFAEFVESPEAAVLRAKEMVGGRARVVVFPYGGATYPELDGSET
jgi:nickel-dependent lactate racemase